MTLSANAAFGDADDMPIGSVNLPVPLSNTFFAGTNTHTFNATPDFAGLQIPASAPAGQYHAFLAAAPRTPHVDPNPGEAPGKLPGAVTVGMPSFPSGDYNSMASSTRRITCCGAMVVRYKTKAICPE
jgi:hypothetical protein